MLWVVFAVLTGIALVSVLWPLMRAGRGVDRAESEVAFFNAQSEEIARDVERGLMTAEDAALAKAEAARRLIALAGDEDRRANGSKRAAFLAAGIAIVAIPGLALGIYWRLGNPGVPDLPLVARLQAPPEQMDINAALAQIEKHLAQNPDDARGYELVAPVYMRLGRAADAARALANTIRLTGGSAQKYDALGEALVYANNGKVNAEAERAFEQATAAAPEMPQPQFYLGLAAEQRGDLDRARAVWGSLLAKAPPGADWAEMVGKRLGAISGVAPDISGGSAIANLAPQDRQAAIRSMVDGLAAKLSQDGRYLDGWLRLVRAYAVLNEKDLALSALADARRSFALDPSGLTQIEALARELGLGG